MVASDIPHLLLLSHDLWAIYGWPHVGRSYFIHKRRQSCISKCRFVVIAAIRARNVRLCAGVRACLPGPIVLVHQTKALVTRNVVYYAVNY